MFNKHDVYLSTIMLYIYIERERGGGERQGERGETERETERQTQRECMSICYLFP